MYRSYKEIIYIDYRTGKKLTTPIGYWSDGATGGLDVCNDSFFAHDWGCGNWAGKGPKPIGGIWDDGSKMTNYQLSNLHSDMIRQCSKKQKIVSRKIILYLMAIWRWPITFMFGGGAARKNGMLKLKKGLI